MVKLTPTFLYPKYEILIHFARPNIRDEDRK